MTVRAAVPHGATTTAFWSRHGSLETGLQRVPASGGTPQVVTRPNRERGEADHLWPHYLPGSRAALFTITALTGGMEAAQVAVLDVKAGTWKSLIPNASQAQYVSSGHLVYVAGEALWAVAFDLSRLEPTGVRTRGRPAGLDAADRHSRIRCRSRRHVGVRDGRWRGVQAAAGVGRSQREARRDSRHADPTVRRCAAVTGWLPGSGSDRRWRQRYLGLGSGPRDVDAGDHRSGSGPGLPSGHQMANACSSREAAASERCSGRRRTEAEPRSA